MRRALGWRKYTVTARKELIAEVQHVALQHDDSHGLLHAALEWGRREHVVRPGLTTLEADISTATARAERQLYQWIHTAPPKETRAAFWARLDRLVVPGKTPPLSAFKVPPGAPSADNLIALCQRLTELETLARAGVTITGADVSLISRRPVHRMRWRPG